MIILKYFISFYPFQIFFIQEISRITKKSKKTEDDIDTLKALLKPIDLMEKFFNIAPPELSRFMISKIRHKRISSLKPIFAQGKF